MSTAREVARDILTDFSSLSRNDADHLAGMIVAAILPGEGYCTKQGCRENTDESGPDRLCPFHRDFPGL